MYNYSLVVLIVGSPATEEAFGREELLSIRLRLPSLGGWIASASPTVDTSKLATPLTRSGGLERPER